jgi:hypothetical protein
MSCLALHAQTGLPVYDRLAAQQEAYPLERVYVHTDAEDYLQGDRIWLKAYLMDEVDHTPMDSTLYMYADLFDKNGRMARQVKLLRREGAFFGYLDIPEDMLSGAAYLRAYTRYMAAAPETAFTKRIVVGRGSVREPDPDRLDGNLSIQRRQHAIRLSYPGKELQYLLVLRGGLVSYLGSVGHGRTVSIPDGALPDGPLDFLVVNREGKVLARQEQSLDRGKDRCPVPIALDRAQYLVGDSVSLRVDPSALRAGELLDLSVSVTCRPLMIRHRPASITDYVLGRSLGFDYADALRGAIRLPAEREATSSLTGTVRTLFLGRPVKEARIGLISPEAGVLDVQWSGPDGRFRFEGLDYPAGTHYLVKTTDRKGNDRYELDLDAESFPAFRIPRNPYATALDDTLHVVYADDDNPFGNILLSAAGVTATVDGPPPTGFNRNSDFAITASQLESRGYTSLYELLQEVPGIFFRDGLPHLRANASIYGDRPAAIAVDGFILSDMIYDESQRLPSGNYDLDFIPMTEIARVDIFKTGQTVLWGSAGGGGVISITTKSGDSESFKFSSGPTVHRSVVPLGYQRAEEFEKADAYRNRRTVYWNPQLLSDTCSFRLGDTPGTYLVVVEGVTSDGRLVHEEIPFDVSQ